KIKTIAVLATAPGLDIKAFCDSLQESLNFHGKTIVLNEKQKTEFGESKYQLLNWLSITETQSEFVIFEGNQHMDEWTKQSLRQADKVLIIKRNQNELIDRELYKELVSIRDSKKKNEWEVVLNSPSPSVASNQEFERRFWLSEPNDMARLARAISGKEIQLILGGGGARGFAHLGVIRAMEELRIPIDHVAGTSIGSVIGALVAKRMKHADIMKLVKKAFLDEKPMKGMRLPVLSLVSDKNLNKMLMNYLGDEKIQDLPIPFFATASNLSTAQLEIMEHGMIRKAVRASISLPTVFPPAVKGNHLLVDGGVFDNLPVMPMMDRADGIRIGVDLTSFKERDLGYEEVPSTGAFLKDR
ncbi:MAG: patatin-like phospholipase family protein, partial [Bacteroidota bacterium]